MPDVTIRGLLPELDDPQAFEEAVIAAAVGVAGLSISEKGVFVYCVPDMWPRARLPIIIETVVLKKPERDFSHLTALNNAIGEAVARLCPGRVVAPRLRVHDDEKEPWLIHRPNSRS